MRKDLLALGKFCLNLTNIPAQKYPNYGEELYDILQMLVPKSHYIAMTLENMNTLEFIPKYVFYFIVKKTRFKNAFAFILLLIFLGKITNVIG